MAEYSFHKSLNGAYPTIHALNFSAMKPATFCVYVSCGVVLGCLNTCRGKPGPVRKRVQTGKKLSSGADLRGLRDGTVLCLALLNPIQNGVCLHTQVAVPANWAQIGDRVVTALLLGHVVRTPKVQERQKRGLAQKDGEPSANRARLGVWGDRAEPDYPAVGTVTVCRKWAAGYFRASAKRLVEIFPPQGTAGEGENSVKDGLFGP